MYCKNKTRMMAALIVIVSILIAGCSTNSLKFRRSEMKLIPVVSLPKVLSPGKYEEVKVWSDQGEAKVKDVIGIEEQKYVIVTDVHQGKEIKLAISEITEIERIRLIEKDEYNKKGMTRQEKDELLFWAPCIPFAIALYPLFQLMDLGSKKEVADARKRDEVRAKASLAYEGLTKEDLRTYIGVPKETYHCTASWGDYEVWVYRNDQVLRGGRALLIGMDDGKVYQTSSVFPSWDPCSPVMK